MAAILTSDWDAHVPLAKPFVRRKKTVYIDKPVACSDDDLAQLLAWEGERLVLGSSNRHAPELLRWRGCPEVRSLLSCVGQPDPFGYGIHAVEIGQTILGPGARRVRALRGGEGGFLFEIDHQSGIPWLVNTQKPAPTFHVLLETTCETRFIPIAGGTWHRLLIEEVFKVRDGGKPRLGAEEMVEAVRILKAAHTSARDARRWVRLDEPLLSFSGRQYRRAYLAARSQSHPTSPPGSDDRSKN
ncbi:MAG TPA: hypothetical protein VNQ90_12310 [Chthoniobacteraceae bacterium]|nr:hypothetical protein [Chthoniobacteraceae bacterium]